mmetsp:Transcript_15019/g.31333  ORF Transcript_15019/g.31333 Transcript_15019/m.31333 type:complete len:349 (+) Transcript_15019:476-1522(+)
MGRSIQRQASACASVTLHTVVQWGELRYCSCKSSSKSSENKFRGSPTNQKMQAFQWQIPITTNRTRIKATHCTKKMLPMRASMRSQMAPSLAKRSMRISLRSLTNFTTFVKRVSCAEPESSPVVSSSASCDHGTVLPKSMANQPRRYFLAMTLRSKINEPGATCTSFSVASTAVLKEITTSMPKIKVVIHSHTTSKSSGSKVDLKVNWYGSTVASIRTKNITRKSQTNLPHHLGLSKPWGQMADCTSSLLMLKTTLSAILATLSCALLTAFCMVKPGSSLELAWSRSSSSSVRKIFRSERGNNCRGRSDGFGAVSASASVEATVSASIAATPALTLPGAGKFSQASFN